MEIDGEEFHCVTGWSVKLAGLRGVKLKDVINMFSMNTKWIGFKSVKGYSTIIPFEEALEKQAFIITHLWERPLSKEHGFPVRLFLPKLYGWKSLKQLSTIYLLDKYEDGYWETLGYHERGLVEVEERFKVRNPSFTQNPYKTGRYRPLPHS